MPARALSVSRQISERFETKPFGLPSVKGELANSAVMTGCSAMRHAQLLDHVGFGREVEVGLHRAGAIHHVEAERADLRHVIGHDLVAALRHHRHVGARPIRRHADAEEADAERARNFTQLREMREQLRRGLMDTLDRRAGQFELSARLERDRAAAGDVEHADDVVALHDRLPAEQAVHAVQERADRPPALVRNGTPVIDREGEFLVLGAGPKLRFRLASRLEPRDQFVAGLERRHVDLVTRHEAGLLRFGLMSEGFKRVVTLNTGAQKAQCRRAFS